MKTTLSIQRQLKGSNHISSFLQWTAPIACFFCEGCTWHHLHILVKAPLSCDWKGRAASALNSHCCTKQQWRSHVVIIIFLLVRATWVLFIMHIPFVANCTFNTMLNEKLQHLHQGWARLFEMTESERDK